MTIAPFSILGNTQGATAQTGGGGLGSGGFAGFFAALLGGQNMEGFEGLGLNAASEGSEEFSDIFSLFKDIDLEASGGLGETLKMFLPPNMEGLIGSGSSPTDILKGLFPGNTDIAGEGLDGLISSKEGQIEVFYQKIVIEIQKVAVSLHVSGIDLSGVDSLGALAKSFEKLGMSSAEALEKADRVDEAIKLMQRRLGIETADVDNNNSLASAIYNIMSSGSGFSQAEMYASQTQIQMSRTTIAFESSSTLISADIGMKVMKGEPLQPALQGQIGESLKTAEMLASTASDKGALSPQAKLAEFEALTADNIPKQTIAAKAAEAAVTDAAKAQQQAVPMTQKSSAEIAQLADDTARFVAANEEPVQNKKRVSEVPSDKVIGESKVQDLFTVKAQGGKGGSEQLNLQLETAAGDVVELDGIDESIEDVMEIVARKVSLDSRVDGFSKQAMVKTATIASQVNIQMRQLIGQGGGQINFRLDPPELGEIDIQLQISKGTVKGTIIVQSLEAAEQLARDLRLLQQSLQDAGLNLSDEGLQFKLKDDQPSSDHRQSEGDSREDGDDDIESDSVMAGTGKSQQQGWVKPDAIVDVSV